MFFDAKHWGEAAIAYREIAMSHDDGDFGVLAAERYLESINVLAVFAEPPRQDCYDDIERDVPTFLDIHCKGAVGARRAKVCLNLFHLQRDIERVACTVPVAHGNDSAEIAKLYAKGGLAYLQRARVCCDSALRFGSSPQVERCDELAFYAGKALLLAGLRARAEEALEIVREPKNGLQNGAFTARLIEAIEDTLNGEAPKRP